MHSELELGLFILARTLTHLNFDELCVWWLNHHAYDQHGLGSKPTHAILLCSWERHLTELFPAWWSWQEVLNFNHISILLQADRNVLASSKACQGNCQPYVLVPPSPSCKSGG